MQTPPGATKTGPKVTMSWSIPTVILNNDNILNVLMLTDVDLSNPFTLIKWTREPLAKPRTNAVAADNDPTETVGEGAVKCGVTRRWC